MQLIQCECEEMNSAESATLALNVQFSSESQLTDDVVERRVVGAREEVGEEVDHDEAVLLALKLLNLY